MDIITKTLDRTMELAGGIYSVAKLPTHAKKANARLLLSFPQSNIARSSFSREKRI